MYDAAGEPSAYPLLLGATPARHDRHQGASNANSDTVAIVSKQGRLRHDPPPPDTSCVLDPCRATPFGGCGACVGRVASQPHLGAGADANWKTDQTGREFALPLRNATLRDFARLGRLHLEGSMRDWRQTVPPDGLHALANTTVTLS